MEEKTFVSLLYLETSKTTKVMQTRQNGGQRVFVDQNAFEVVDLVVQWLDVMTQFLIIRLKLVINTG